MNDVYFLAIVAALLGATYLLVLGISHLTATESNK